MRNALFFLACFSILFCFNGANAEEQNVKIGFLSPQTGPIAVYAEGLEMGGEIAIDDLNAKYEGEYNFELVIADSACDENQADDAAQELVDEGVIGIAGAACSGATLGAMPVAKDAQIPLISYSSTSSDITDADDDGYLWRIVPSDDQIGLGLANLAYVEDYSYPSVIYDGSWAYLESAAEYFEEVWGNSGMDVCNMQSIYEGQTDFSDEVDNIENDECDSVVIFSYNDEMVGIIEELHEQYVDIGMFGTQVDPEYFIDSFEDDYDVDGVYTMNYSTKWNVHNPAVREHVDEECDDRSNDCDSYIYYHESYDTVKIIAEAFVMSGGDYDDVNSFIGDIGVTYIGATYSLFFDTNGDIRGPGYDICEFSGGIWSAYYNCDGIWQPRFGVLYDDTVVNVPLGFLNPLTGPIAAYAEGFTVSWDVAEDHLNEIYGFLNFDVWEEDSGCDGTMAADAAQYLVDDGVYAIAGAACSGATLGAMEVTRDNQIPQVAYPSTSPAITTADDDGYLFRVVPSDAQQGQAIGDLVAYYGLENPALLYMTNDYGAGTADAVETRLDEHNIETCVKIGYDDGQTDFEDEVSVIIDSECDSVVMVTYANDGAAIIEELRDQSFHWPIFGGDGIADQAFLGAFTDPTDAEGVFATKGVYEDGNTIEGEYFMADYDEKCDDEYNGGDCEDNGIYLYETYDSVMILGRAIYASGYSGLGSGGDSGETIRDMLPYVGKSYQGASGLIDFDENGDISGSGYDICRFEYVEDELQFVCHGSWTLRNGIRGLDGIEIISNEPPVVWIGDVSIIGMDYIEENYYFCEDDDEIGCDNIDETKIEAIFSQEEYGYVYLSSNHYDESSYLEEYEWYSDLDGFIGDTSSLMFYSDEDVFLSEGLHNISVRGMDSFGLWSNWSESLELEIIYNIRPTVNIQITDPQDNLVKSSYNRYSHFCCSELYFSSEVFDDSQIVSYEWFLNGELISEEKEFFTDDYNIGSYPLNNIHLRVQDNLGFWSYPESSNASLSFFVYPISPILKISVIFGDYVDSFGQNVTIEIEVEPSQYISYEQSYYLRSELIEDYEYLSIYEDQVEFQAGLDSLSLELFESHGDHEFHFEICHSRNFAGGEENWDNWDFKFCSSESIEFRINTPPIALIEDIANSDSPASSHYNEKIFFEGQGIDEDGKIVEYAWVSSIDGLISTNESFSTSELSIGTHVITLSVEDDDGRWNESEPFELFIYTNPIAHAGEDITIEPGNTVQFAGAGTDEDGEIVKYEWDLNGDGIFEFKSENTGLTTFIYNNEGSFTVTLRVTDNDGNVATDEMIVTVESVKNEIPDEGLPSVSFVMALTALSLIALRRKH